MEKEQVKKAIKKLLEWVPEAVPLEKISRANYPVKIWGKVFSKGDDEQPFFSEAYLYPLLGKSDARTLLALMWRLCESLGIKTDL